jgi:hypothetical protein
VRRIACTLGAVATAAALTGCSEDLDARSPDLGDEAALELGRVHVLVDRTEASVDPTDLPGDTGGPVAESFSSIVEVSARFAYVRGFDEEFARSHADIPVLASDILRTGQCIPTDQLAVHDGPGDSAAHERRELVLLDAGEIAVDVARNKISVPASLVPDLLPYMSGVEYLYLGDATADPVLEISASELTVHVSAEGAQADELSDFTVDGRIPAPPVLDLGGNIDENNLRLTWEGEQESEAVVVVIATTAGDEFTGTEVTCLFKDVGVARVDVGTLRLQGLDLSVAEGLIVQASRLQRTTFDAGDFADAELIVESRDSITVDLADLTELPAHR